MGKDSKNLGKHWAFTKALATSRKAMEDKNRPTGLGQGHIMEGLKSGVK